jgi:hypothetical protein
MTEQDQPREPTDRQRNQSNLILLVGFIVIVGIGIWLVNAMLDAREADDCISQGRRNCAPIDTPTR